MLVVVVVASLVVNVWNLQDEASSTIGVLPQGFPPFTVPTVDWSDVSTLFLGAVAIAVVALADTMSTASAFAARRGDRVHGDQEMVGIGAANIAAGLFQGFPVSTSGSRTAVADQAGSRSQVTGLVGAAVIAFVLMFATGLMQYVPQATLGAIVIAAALSLADIPATRRLWHQRRTEFALSIVAFLGVALLGVLPGILLAIALSILNVFRRVWWPHQAELGRVDGIAGLHDTERYPARERPARPRRLPVRRAADLRQLPHLRRRRTRHGRGGPGGAVGARGRRTDHRRRHDGGGHARGPGRAGSTSASVSLVFAELKDPVREKIERYELTRTIDPNHFYRDPRRGGGRLRGRDGRDLEPDRRGRTEHERAARGRCVPTPGSASLAWLALLAAAAARRRCWSRQAVRRWDVLLATVVVAGGARGGRLDRAEPHGDPSAPSPSASCVAALAVFVVVVVWPARASGCCVVALGLAVVGGGGAARRSPATRRPAPPSLERAHGPQHPVLIMNLQVRRREGRAVRARRAVPRARDRTRRPHARGRICCSWPRTPWPAAPTSSGMAGGDGSQALVASVASRARDPVRGRPGRHPQPLRPRPRPRPRRRGRARWTRSPTASYGSSTWPR